jgi:hypothetical protein
MSRLVMDALRPLHPVRVENAVHPGTPDINYVGGWIENKEVPSWPSSDRWHLRIPHFTVQQRLWLRQRVMKGGRAHLLLKVASEWLLLRGDVAADLIGESSPAQLRAAADLTWRTDDKDGWDRLLNLLRQ